MNDLIAALQLMATKAQPDRPFHCEHDELTVCVDPKLFTEEELVQLDEWGFHEGSDGDSFYSFRFGSA